VRALDLLEEARCTIFMFGNSPAQTVLLTIIPLSILRRELVGRQDEIYEHNLPGR
jgi:hypothetical protein